VEVGLEEDASQTPLFAKLRDSLRTASRLSEIEDLADGFEAFVRSGEIFQLLLSRLQGIARDPMTRVEGLGKEYVSLFENERFMVMIQDLPPSVDAEGRNPEIISTSACNSIQVLLPPSERLLLVRYALDRPVDLAIFDPDRQLLLVDERPITPRSGCFRYHAGEVLAVRHVGRVQICQILEKQSLDYQWYFRGGDLSPMFCASSRVASSRLETLIEVVAEFAEDRIEPAIAASILSALVTHPLHFVRWKAVQALGAVDEPLAIQALEGLQSDAHPHVRDAARQALLELTQ
jgi:hypothetical protein